MPPFNWTTFLLGFAIALWIALVLLFILPDDDQPPAASVCPISSCCCGGPGIPPIPDWPLEVPSGPEPYFCTNNDNGGGVVQDNGGGIVQDNGGGIVQDDATRVPVPTAETLGEPERDVGEFWCEINDNGGGIVQDSGTLRSVVVPMEKGPAIWCFNNNGHAQALIRLANNNFQMIRYDGDNNRLTTPGEIADPVPRVQYPDAAADGFVFCTVSPDADDPPQIVADDNSCIAKFGGC